MSVHKVCVGCRWNDYPHCIGTIMYDGNFMNIENLKPLFNCGRKNKNTIKDFSIKIKSDLELRIEELEERIIELEK